VKFSEADTLKTRPTLLSKVRRGDEEGWSRFYEFYEDFIYSSARAAGLSHEESKDVVQETMITVQNYVSSFVPDESRAQFRTWLRKIVQSRIADQYRKRKRNPLAKAADDRQRAEEDSATSTTNRIADPNVVELDRLVDAKLEEAVLLEARRLTKQEVRMEHYQAYDLFRVQELSAADVAVSLGIRAVTVRVWAFRVGRVVSRHARQIARMLENPSHPDATGNTGGTRKSRE